MRLCSEEPTSAFICRRQATSLRPLASDWQIAIERPTSTYHNAVQKLKRELTKRPMRALTKVGKLVP